VDSKKRQTARSSISVAPVCPPRKRKRHHAAGWAHGRRKRSARSVTSPRSQIASQGACVSLDAFHRRRTGKKSGVASVSADALTHTPAGRPRHGTNASAAGRFLAAWPTRKVGFQELGWFAGSASGCTAEMLTPVAVTP
jgi:hypothetical protein